MFVCLIIRTFRLVFSVEIVFFSHKNQLEQSVSAFQRNKRSHMMELRSCKYMSQDLKHKHRGWLNSQLSYYSFYYTMRHYKKKTLIASCLEY